MKYSDLAIECALTLRLIFSLPLCQTEGFLTSAYGMMDVERDVPDHPSLREGCVTEDPRLH